MCAIRRRQFATSAPAAGDHAIAAAHSGDANFAASIGSLTQIVSKIVTATTVASSASPSIPGHAVTYTATVSPAPDGGRAGAGGRRVQRDRDGYRHQPGSGHGRQGGHGTDRPVRDDRHQCRAQVGPSRPSRPAIGGRLTAATAVPRKYSHVCFGRRTLNGRTTATRAGRRRHGLADTGRPGPACPLSLVSDVV